MGAPVFDAGRRAFPVFAKANKVTGFQWVTMDPPLRETMLARGDVDAITGFTFTSLLNLEARGVKAEDVVVLPYADFGVKHYGNVVIASPKLIKENPAAVKAFLQAFTKGVKDVVADPAAAIEFVKARDGIINVPLEVRRLRLAIDTVINSPDARAEGFGQVKAPRLTLMASQVSDAFGTKTRVEPRRWCGTALSCPRRPNSTCCQSQEISMTLADCSTAPSSSSTSSDVWLAYNDELLARKQFSVEAIDLQVRQGEFIAIVGPSGCGKSTFMKLATGLKMPSAGRILIDGRPVTGPLKISGMAFQAPSLLPWRTTVGNVLLPLEIVEPYRSQFKAKRKEFEERARRLLQRWASPGTRTNSPGSSRAACSSA